MKVRLKSRLLGDSKEGREEPHRYLNAYDVPGIVMNLSCVCAHLCMCVCVLCACACVCTHNCSLHFALLEGGAESAPHPLPPPPCLETRLKESSCPISCLVSLQGFDVISPTERAQNQGKDAEGETLKFG